MSKNDSGNDVRQKTGSTHRMPDLSDNFTCAECGGRLQITDEGNTDASAWETHECVDCGGEGEFYISEGTKRDGGKKRGVTERNYDLQP